MTRRLLLAATVMASMGSAAAQVTPYTASFRVTLAGRPLGTAMADVSRTAEGWSIRGTSELGAPLALSVRRFDAAYTLDWMPRGVTMDLASGEETLVVHGGFGGGSTSRIDLVRNRQVVFLTAAVSGDALILPAHVLPAYEALAARLAGATPGSEWRVYVIPQREVGLRLDQVADVMVRAGPRAVPMKRWRVTFLNPGGEVPADVWVDGSRLARIDFPDQMLSMVRQDVAG